MYTATVLLSQIDKWLICHLFTQPNAPSSPPATSSAGSACSWSPRPPVCGQPGGDPAADVRESTVKIFQTYLRQRFSATASVEGTPHLRRHLIRLDRFLHDQHLHWPPDTTMDIQRDGFFLSVCIDLLLLLNFYNISNMWATVRDSTSKSHRSSASWVLVGWYQGCG